MTEILEKFKKYTSEYLDELFMNGHADGFAKGFAEKTDAKADIPAMMKDGVGTIGQLVDDLQE